MKEEIAERDTEIARLRVTTSDAQRDCQRLRERLSIREQRNEELQQELNAMTNKLHAAEKATGHQRNAALLQEELESARRMSSQYEQKIRENRDELERRERSFQQMSQQLTQTEEELSKLKAQYPTMQSKLQASTQALNQRDTRIAEYERELDRLREELLQSRREAESNREDVMRSKRGDSTVSDIRILQLQAEVQDLTRQYDADMRTKVLSSHSRNMLLIMSIG